MRIQNNISAINTLNQISKNQNIYSNIMERLSSGLRINKASDDAAGLAISEKMKSQIRGLKTNERNILDGVSLIQTADAGLSNIQEMLQRARELTVQAANGTLTGKDREAIQREINHLKKGIDDIANRNEFNKVELLHSPKVPVNQDIPDSPSMDRADIVFFIDDSSTMQEEIDQVVNGISQFLDGLSSYGDVQVATVSTVHGERLLPLTSNVETIQNYLVNKHVASTGTNYAYKSMINYAPDGAKGDQIGYRNGSKKIYVLLTDTRNESMDYTELEVKNALERNNVYSYVFGINITGGSSSEQNHFMQVSAYDEFADEVFVPATAGEIAASISPGLVDKIVEDTGFGGEPQLAYEPIILQVGPNVGETFTMNLFDARTINLEIDQLKVSTIADAQEAMGALDKAIEMVSTARSRFGAYQNSLEHILNNVTQYNENLTAAQSRISDADMAEEMAKYTTRNILNQSAQAMLSQANQLPQGILQLLK